MSTINSNKLNKICPTLSSFLLSFQATRNYNKLRLFKLFLSPQSHSLAFSTRKSLCCLKDGNTQDKYLKKSFMALAFFFLTTRLSTQGNLNAGKCQVLENLDITINLSSCSKQKRNGQSTKDNFKGEKYQGSEILQCLQEK